MSDQVDPKWPANKPIWEELYETARGNIQEAGSGWAEAFDAIIVADRAGAFQYLRTLHEQSKSEWGLWLWRWGLWELFCKPIFDRPRAEWPSYAGLLYDAIPPEWTEENGAVEGIPKSWRDPPTADPEKIWAFKSTVVLIAGLIEGALVPAPRDMMRIVMEFVERNAEEPLRSQMSSLLRKMQDGNPFTRLPGPG